MGLIKSLHAPASLTPFSMRDVEAAARAIIARATEQADALLADAQAEAQLLGIEAKREAFELGKIEGRKHGAAEGRIAAHEQALAEHQASLAQLLEALAAIAGEVDRQRQALAADAESSVLKLAAAISRKVVKRLGVIDGQAVLSANLSEAVKLVVGAEDIRIAVHPSQRETLETSLPALKLTWPQMFHVELFEDPNVAPGGCRVHTRGGLVDADLDQQIDRIVADLLGQPGSEKIGSGT